MATSSHQTINTRRLTALVTNIDEYHVDSLYHVKTAGCLSQDYGVRLLE